MCETEHKLQVHTALFDEWEKIQAHIHGINADLRYPSLDEQTKSDLLEDMAGLKRRKAHLATFLGFDKT